MVEFKKNFKKILSYDRKQYIDYLDDDLESISEWYGVSFQISKGIQQISFTEFVETSEHLFGNIITSLDDGSSWIVNHDDKDMDWFPNEEKNLISLRTLFKDQNIPNTYKGGLVFSKNELLLLSRDLISYPYALLSNESLLYKNLDISHDKLQFVMKVTGHLTIDLLSKDMMLLKKVVKENYRSPFVIKAYRDTNLEL